MFFQVTVTTRISQARCVLREMEQLALAPTTNRLGRGTTYLKIAGRIMSTNQLSITTSPFAFTGAQGNFQTNSRTVLLLGEYVTLPLPYAIKVKKCVYGRARLFVY